VTFTEEDIAQILKLIKESSFDTVHLEIGDLKLIVSKGGHATINSEEPRANSPPESSVTQNSVVDVRAQEAEKKVQKIDDKALVVPEEGAVAINSPMLGIFYRCPAPGAPPYVEVGTFVKKEETICLIKVMKVFNAVKAGVSGYIDKICAESGQLVEYGQPIFFVRSAESAEKRKENV